jgi:hypothetical protein
MMHDSCIPAYVLGHAWQVQVHVGMPQALAVAGVAACGTCELPDHPSSPRVLIRGGRCNTLLLLQPLTMPCSAHQLQRHEKAGGGGGSVCIILHVGAVSLHFVR